MLRFTDALVSRTGDLDGARVALIEVMGPEVVAPAAAAAGNFEMMNRVVDGVNVAIPASREAIAPEIGLDGWTG